MGRFKLPYCGVTILGTSNGWVVSEATSRKAMPGHPPCAHRAKTWQSDNARLLEQMSRYLMTGACGTLVNAQSARACLEKPSDPRRQSTGNYSTAKRWTVPGKGSPLPQGGPCPGLTVLRDRQGTGPSSLADAWKACFGERMAWRLIIGRRVLVGSTAPAGIHIPPF